MKKKENIIVLKPVKIFIDDLEKIFKIIYSKYKENELTIETDDYFYYNFEELSRSPEDVIYRLKIQIKGKKNLEINFLDGIHIKSEDKSNRGLILKIKNILTDKTLTKSSFPYYFMKYNKIWYNIFFVGIPLVLLLALRNFTNYIFLYFIAILLYVISYRSFFIRKYKNFLYSTIILRKKSVILNKELELKEKKVSRIKLFTSIIALLIPFLIYLINFMITKFSR